MPFLEKPWKMWEKTEILNFSQQKEEGTLKYQNQIIILQSFQRKFVSNRNGKNWNTSE